MLERYTDMLTPEEVAEILVVTPKMVRGLISSKKIPAIKIGRMYRIPKELFIESLTKDLDTKEVNSDDANRD